MAETIGRADIIILANGEFFEASVRKIVKDSAPTFDKGGADHARAYSKSFDREKNRHFRDSMSRLEQAMERRAKKWSRIGNVIGRAFGRGSRNDFVNAFGGFMSLGPRLIGLLPRIGQGIGNLGKRFADMREQAGGTLGALKNLAAQGLPGLIAAAASAAVAIRLTIALMGPLASAVVGVMGIVLALAGSLSFALVGGLVAVAGALVPFAAGLGVAALAVAGLKKNTPALKELKQGFKDLKKSAAENIFGKNGKNLQVFSGLLKTIKPLIDDVATSVGGLVTSFGKATKSKAFQDLLDNLRDTLPDMVSKIGKIGGKFALGLGQAFVAAEPLINRFLGWLDKVATKFVDLGKPGKGGKSGLSDFFDQAGKSASILWDLISNVGGIISKVFLRGKGTGDSILQSLADSAEELNKWLSTPEGKKAMDDMFDWAEKMAGKLGEITLHAIEFIRELNSPKSQQTLMLILTIVDKIIVALTLATEMSNKLDAALTGSAGPLKVLSDGADSFKTKWTEAVQGVAFDQLKQRATEAKQGIQTVWGNISGFFTGIANSVSANMSTGWSRLQQRGSEAAAGVKGAWATVTGFFQGIGKAITAGWGGATGTLRRRALEAKNGVVTAFGQIKGKVAAVPGQVAGVFSGLAGKVITKAGNLASAFARWVSSLAGKARTTANGVVTAFSNLAGRMITRAGSILGRFTSWVAGLPGKARSIAQQIANAFSGLASKAIAKAGSITAAIGRWASGVYGRARGVANDIVRAFSGLAGRIVAAIGTIVPKIRMPNIKVPTVVAKVITPKKAAGGIVNGPQIAMIGEAGPEAIVPLNRALSRVDPAVRELSAIAQGLAPRSNNTSTSTMGRTIDVGGITINTPTEDPRAVASEVINRFTAAAYI